MTLNKVVAAKRVKSIRVDMFSSLTDEMVVTTDTVSSF